MTAPVAWSRSAASFIASSRVALPGWMRTDSLRRTFDMVLAFLVVLSSLANRGPDGKTPGVGLTHRPLAC
ncbi:hypothetical protein CHE218_12890 [Microbacterium sp. che218]